MYKEDLTLNNQQWLIFHKTQPNQISTHLIILYSQTTLSKILGTCGGVMVSNFD